MGRRFEHKGEKNDILVVDDYGHHPVEIAATLATARTAYPDRRVVVAFQPHRFSRTQALFGEFCHVLGTVDKLLLTEIYPASEKPIPGVNGQNLAQGIRQVSDADVSYFQNFDEMVAALPDILKPGDLFLTIGAGNVTTVGPRFLALELKIHRGRALVVKSVLPRTPTRKTVDWWGGCATGVPLYGTGGVL